MAEYIPGVDFQAAIEKCELCQEEDAQFYCKDCRQEMCSGCKRSHLRSQVSLNHIVISSNLGKSNRKERKLIKCTSHSKEIIRMYCTNCDEAVCVKCISGTKHKNHNFDELQTTLYRYQDEVSQSITETKQQIADLEKLLQDIDVNVKDYTDLQLTEKEKKDVQKIIHDHNVHLQSCEGTLKSMKNFTAIRRQRITPNPPSITRVYPPTFISQGILNLEEMFGQLRDSMETKSTQKTPKQEKYQKTTPTSDDSEDNSAVNTISTEIVTEIHLGVKCFHMSAVNETEAWCGGGKDLALTDIHGTIKRKINLNGYCMDVAVTSKGEVFVTEYSDTNINKYLTDGKCINILDTQPYKPRGLCVTSQGDLLVCLYNYDSKVVRMTTTGQIKQTIQKNKQHKPLFRDPRYVTENINGDVVVVDEFYPTTIVVINKEGEQRYRYPGSSQSFHTIDGCSGIACDNTGCILVSDWGNHRIHQLDINGRFIKFILTQQHGILDPRGLSIDAKGQLWLCDVGKEVTVFKYRS